ncbi:hypothetical protein AB0E77_33395 [Streptomyces sp. NPDC032940]|uniref:hypothetical protein n=1 Tax=Streptomyces sp. NPDC032940 TaxID=3155366 RepID=UPI0033C24BF2
MIWIEESQRSSSFMVLLSNCSLPALLGATASWSGCRSRARAPFVMMSAVVS